MEAESPSRLADVDHVDCDLHVNNIGYRIVCQTSNAHHTSSFGGTSPEFALEQHDDGM